MVGGTKLSVACAFLAVGVVQVPHSLVAHPSQRMQDKDVMQHLQPHPVPASPAAAIPDQAPVPVMSCSGLGQTGGFTGTAAATSSGNGSGANIGVTASVPQATAEPISRLEAALTGASARRVGKRGNVMRGGLRFFASLGRFV